MMAWGLTSEVVIAVLLEEVLGVGPSPETIGVPEAFRKRVRAEIEEIRAAGELIDVPFEIPDEPKGER